MPTLPSNVGAAAANAATASATLMENEWKATVAARDSRIEGLESETGNLRTQLAAKQGEIDRLVTALRECEGGEPPPPEPRPFEVTLYVAGQSAGILQPGAALTATEAAACNFRWPDAVGPATVQVERKDSAGVWRNVHGPRPERAIPLFVFGDNNGVPNRQKLEAGEHMLSIVPLDGSPGVSLPFVVRA